MNQSETLVFVCAFFAGSVGGLSYVLRDVEANTRRQVAAGILRAGCAGLGSSLLLHQQFSPFMLVGIALVLGMGGEAGVELILNAIVLYIRRDGQQPVGPPPPRIPPQEKPSRLPAADTEVW